jgi:hypothetical protein
MASVRMDYGMTMMGPGPDATPERMELIQLFSILKYHRTKLSTLYSLKGEYGPGV